MGKVFTCHPTTDADWDPSIVDHEKENIEKWFHDMQELLIFTAYTLFENVVDCKHTHQIMEAIQSSNITKSTIITDIDFIIQAYNRHIMLRENAFESYHSKAVWLPMDVIRHTFQSTI